MAAEGGARSGGSRTCAGRWAAGLLGLAAALAGGCGPQYPRERGEGPGHRQQPLALSPQQELAVGRRAYREVMDELGDRVLPADSPQVTRARRITERLVHAAGIEKLQEEIHLR